MKQYTDKEKMKYFENKATEVNNKYKKYNEVLKNKNKCMTYDNVVVTNSNDSYNSILQMIQDKDYQRDMYKILYYTARASGDNHNQAVNFAKENINDDFCIDRVLHMEDIQKELKKGK